MEEAGDNLRKTDTGVLTQSLQKQATDRLEKLVRTFKEEQQRRKRDQQDPQIPGGQQMPPQILPPKVIILLNGVAARRSHACRSAPAAKLPAGSEVSSSHTVVMAPTTNAPDARRRHPRNGKPEISTTVSTAGFRNARLVAPARKRLSERSCSGISISSSREATRMYRFKSGNNRAICNSSR
jgi:hypothetical protein